MLPAEQDAPDGIIGTANLVPEGWDAGAALIAVVGVRRAIGEGLISVDAAAVGTLKLNAIGELVGLQVIENGRIVR